jgi:hypothetical protein
MKQRSYVCSVFAALTAVPCALLAHEEPFGYVKGAQTEAKGEWEVTQWTTARIGKQSGTYLGMDFATEVEYGLSDRLQVAAYLTANYHLLDSATGSSEVFDDLDRFAINGTSVELKYQVSNPFTQPWGFALYVEPEFGTIEHVDGERIDEWGLEVILILQRNFFDHRLITSFNYVFEPEWEREDGEWENNLHMAWLLGASWQFNSHWRAGLESRLHTEFGNSNLNDSEFLVLNLGPTLHYGSDRFYATLTVLPQIAGWPDKHGTSGLHLDEHERVEVRLKLGLEF